jgi:hypothetical protein
MKLLFFYVVVFSILHCSSNVENKNGFYLENPQSSITTISRYRNNFSHIDANPIIKKGDIDSILIVPNKIYGDTLYYCEFHLNSVGYEKWKTACKAYKGRKAILVLNNENISFEELVYEKRCQPTFDDDDFPVSEVQILLENLVDKNRIIVKKEVVDLTGDD